MRQAKEATQSDLENTRRILYGAGYSDKAIAYYLNKPNMGSLSNPDQVTEVTGVCGDTMKIYLKLAQGKIEDAKMQVFGCPGAVASAMAGLDIIKGMNINDAMAITDRDIYRVLEKIPAQKQDCIRLTIKTIQKGLTDYHLKTTGL